jgi:hypothetical protein
VKQKEGPGGDADIGEREEQGQKRRRDEL